MRRPENQFQLPASMVNKDKARSSFAWFRLLSRFRERQTKRRPDHFTRNE